MLGSFSIKRGDHSVDDSSNRMRKVWLLLAYLICNRGGHATKENYLNLLRGGDDEGEDPAGRLKALFYRARTMLDQMEVGAGHELIIRKGGTYAWNTDVPLSLDVEVFEKLCTAAAAAESEEEQLALYLQALELYRGDFLPKLSMEPWVLPLSAYYHQMFLDAAEKVLVMEEAQSRWKEAAALSARILTIEPYSEAISQHLMRCRLALGDREGVIAVYEEISKLLFDTFGVDPSDETRRLYREAARETNDHSVPIDTVREQLRDPVEARGAMFCEYDFFKVLYQAQARAVVRSGDTVHIALLTLRGHGRKPLARRSLDRAVENMKEILIEHLRQGDVVTRCGVSQMVIMLPQANYENSCAVCQRVIKAFYRKYPRTPAEVQYSVSPLEPLTPSQGQR
jgi:DNA-binding SARP family transcriptional activator